MRVRRGREGGGLLRSWGCHLRLQHLGESTYREIKICISFTISVPVDKIPGSDRGGTKGSAKFEGWGGVGGMGRAKAANKGIMNCEFNRCIPVPAHGWTENEAPAKREGGETWRGRAEARDCLSREWVSRAGVVTYRPTFKSLPPVIGTSISGRSNAPTGMPMATLDSPAIADMAVFLWVLAGNDVCTV